MSSTPQKPTSKMCKSPKNSNFHAIKSEKIINEYENYSTNCTVIGSNNLHLVKKPQVITSVSPAYSNPSPGYPQSPYSSPASLKSPSPQNFKPPTPQPTYPVMQIIQSSHQLLARPLQSQQQNVIKLKPHLNILPKPSASPQPSPKPSVSPHIVIPSQQTTTIMPTAQPLLLNQMPMLAPGVQLILRPQTTKLPTHMQTSATAQGLILQPSHQQVLQIQSPRATQQMVRVLTNGMHLAPHTQVVSQVASPVISQSTTQHAHMIHHNEHNLAISYANSNSPPKKKPKKKKQKLDLANIMKLSGIGDEDDIQFESDTSQSESEPNTVQLHSDIHHQTHNVIQEANIIRSQANVIQATDVGKRIGNIQFSTIPQATTQTPLVQLLNQGFPNGVNNASFQTSQPQAGIPLNSFITPNITINNGLVVQRNGGFKLALGEDGRLVLQHDPTLHQDLQSQLLLQSLFGLNGLVLQPSIDQQVHSQTVQTIQQQSVQTIQQQTVQSQTIQTVQQQAVQSHTLPTIQQTIQPQIQAVQPQTVQQTVQQTIQHQTVQSQPLPTLHQHPHSQPMQIVQPQPIHTIQSHNIHQHTIQSQPVTSLQSPVVHAIQSQVHQSIQSQIQGQLQTLLQSQSLLQPQPVHSHAQSSHVTSTIQSHPQTQPILKVQPFHKTPPVQTVHPQPVQTIQHHQTHQTLSDNATHQPQPPQPQYVVNLTPDQLEQLKRNGQISVNGQTIFMQRPNVVNKVPEQVHHQNNENKVKLSPKIKTVKKTNKIATNTSPVKNLIPDNVGLKSTDDKSVVNNVIKEAPKNSLVSALQAPPKIAPVQNHVQVQPQQKAHSQPSAVIQPSIAVQPTVQTSVGSQTQLSKPPVQTKLHQAKLPNTHTPNSDSGTGNNQDMDHLIGQILEESNTSTNVPTTSNNQVQPPQRIHTIQLTPQQQQHLKSVQLQIQTLSARLTPGDTEMHNALKLLFAEQQKILASGKLLPPDKVIYQNNQLTIINPSSLGIGNLPIKSEPQVLQAPVLPRTINSETCNSHPISTTVPVQQVPKITVPIPTVTEHVTHSKTAPTQTLKVATAAAPSVQPTASTHAHQNKFIPSFTKAQLLEQQLNTDQNGAMKPDVYTPFRDKADACKRLIRYHCYNQPVLSQKDLNKADEIFELTAKHFIDKFRRMVDKYRFLLNKESMRQVQTSELMMLDRMFYAEEQQSMMRLRQDMKEGSSHYSMDSDMHDSSNPLGQSPQEEYDEWACIQRELGCLQSNVDDPKQLSTAQQQKLLSLSLQAGSNLTNNLSSKRSASSDSRLETLKKFRVDKHNKRLVGEGGGVNAQNNFISGSNIQTNNFSASGGGSGGGLKVPQRNAQVQQIITNVQNTQSSPTGSNVQSARQNVHVSLQQQQVVHNQQHGTRSVHYATHSGAQNVFHSTNISHHHQYVQYSQGQDIGPNLHSLYGGGQIIQQHGASQQNMTTNSVYNNANNNLSVNNKMNSGSLSSESESGNNSIDEHVQSAIDSILNLQQSSNLDLDEAVSSILS